MDAEGKVDISSASRFSFSVWLDFDYFCYLNFNLAPISFHPPPTLPKVKYEPWRVMER